ncbi:MAG: DNA polymerase III subunit alpha, partial [Clostridia bacterium]
IADKCNIEIEKEKLLPNYVPPDNLTPAEYLRALIEKGLKEKYTETPEIRERIEYEYNTVVSMGFVEYYLIVWDFIHYAEEQGIPVGPGRGSGAGSIIAYLIGITKVEPLRYHLIFERFLNPERVSMPDFDVDFCAERRGEVIEYVKAKYGEGKVSQIVTFGTMAAKNAIKDVGRVLRVPYADTDRITKLIPGGKVSLKKLLGLEKNEKGEAEDAIPELVDLYKNDQQLRRVIDLAVQLEGSPRQTGMHAAGVVICRDRIEDHVPLQRNGEDITTQYNMIEVEKLGLLKMDFLGLRNLTDIKKAIDFVKRETGETIDFYKNNNYDDPKVYELISSGETMGIFQLESEGMRKLMSRLKPTCLEDIIAGISLFRPGPMQFIDVYVDGKHNPQNITYLHPLLEPILNVTYGC